MNVRFNATRFNQKPFNREFGFIKRHLNWTFTNLRTISSITGRSISSGSYLRRVR